jgi:hypothetical protein
MRAAGRTVPTVETKITRPKPRSFMPGTRRRTSRTLESTFL